ncbi:ras-associating and dilute domain-containing protein-like isoform X2 [Acanthaster planci]|nr:ras-associating and dilute domain-containing protein-like isoform X2 [Acanthaster planci]XP_022095523.1 ras-associating and dilute domain-containing protein-like isoform X2 [Acanthaster planci]XP_022095525.1 ras-associating and dilute domain-containing protein-like isoform X2 [Acanthaster planci]
MMDPEIIEQLRLSSGLGSGKRGSLGGLFQQKRDRISLLTDPLAVAHLNQLNRAALDETRSLGCGEDAGTPKMMEEAQRRQMLEQKIATYNRGKNGQAFMVTMTEGMNFEGALRFYYDDGSKTTAKAIWLSSRVTVLELLPRIHEKFTILVNGRWKTVIYQVQNQDKILLADEERPLDIAVNSGHNVRFVLKMEPHHQDNQHTGNPGSAAAQHKCLSQFFGVKSADLTVPYYTGSVAASPISKAKLGSPSLSSRVSKKLGSVDSASLSSNGSTNSSGPPSGSYSKRSYSAGSIGNGGMPGLLLKAETPTFIRRFQSRERTLRNFIKKDKGSSRKMPSKELSPKHRSRAKSLSSVFEKGFTLLKKDDTLNPAKEADAEDSSPGLLKIFGDNICPNTTYKSVLASAQSSAVALIKVVLERFSLPIDTFGEYVLCDVIGNYKANPEKSSRVLGISEDFEEKQEWMTECMRVIGDNERPLAIKSYWKPEVGFARRFEIRRRSDIAVPDADTITLGINLNAKRLQMSRANRASAGASLARFLEEQDQTLGDVSSCSKRAIMSEEPPRQISQGQSEREETESSDEQLPAPSLLPPQDFPYLLTLQGDNPDSDQILYPLDSVSCLVGHAYDSRAKADVELDSTNVNREHCRILTQYITVGNNPFDMSVEPIGESRVLINGVPVSKRTELIHGDMIGIGDHYLFLLKKPLAQTANESSLMRLLSLANQSDSSTHLSGSPNSEMTSQPKYASLHIATKAKEYSTDSQRLKLSYPMRREDELLSEIALLFPGSLAVDERKEFTLSLSYLACMCVEHSAYNFRQERTKRLMMKVASLIQALAWDKTKEMARTQPEKPTDVQTAVGALLPDLRVIVCLLTNALEVLNFLQASMGDYVATCQGSEAKPSQLDTDQDEVGGNLGIEDEALVELEEVVMYTFQQMVYYLTKTLHIAIPDFLDTNPFSDNDGDDTDTRKKGMDSVLSVFQMTFDLMHDLAVHPEIMSQLFAYLLFFTNASLFNMLIERGSDGKFYKWSKGAQIRGNLDVLEAWIQDHSLQDQAKFLIRVSMATDLLATPKVQLIQADWTSLKSDFSDLNTVQLHHFLSQYQLAANQTRPVHWLPPPEEMKTATEIENLFESFDNHPALALPNHGFTLDLRQPITSQHFIDQLQELKRHLPYITFSPGSEDATGNSSLSVNQPPAEKPSVQRVRTPSPSRGYIGLPVPPPRTKSYRYPLSDQATSVEVLERPLEVVLAAPVNLANTVKLSPTEGNFLSKDDKMSPRVFADKPLSTSKAVNGVSKSESCTKVGDAPNKQNNKQSDLSEISSTQAESECTRSVTSTPTVITPAGTTAELMNTASEPTHLSHDVRVVQVELPKEEAIEKRLQTGIGKRADGHLEEFEEPKKPCPTLSSSASSVSSFCSSTLSAIATETERFPQRKDAVDDVFVVDLEKGEEGVGLGLIDGMHTPLRSQGIFVRKLVPGSSAMQNGRLIVGDRILAVNGTSLVGADYNSAMHLIRTSGKKLRFLVAKSEPSVALKVTASAC